MRWRGQAKGDDGPVDVGEAVRIDQAALGVDVFGEMVVAPEGGDEFFRQRVGVGGPGLTGGAEESRELAEGVSNVALGDAVPAVARRELGVETGTADQAIVGLATQQV